MKVWLDPCNDFLRNIWFCTFCSGIFLYLHTDSIKTDNTYLHVLYILHFVYNVILMIHKVLRIYNMSCLKRMETLEGITSGRRIQVHTHFTNDEVKYQSAEQGIPVQPQAQPLLPALGCWTWTLWPYQEEMVFQGIGGAIWKETRLFRCLAGIRLFGCFGHCKYGAMYIGHNF